MDARLSTNVVVPQGGMPAALLLGEATEFLMADLLVHLTLGLPSPLGEGAVLSRDLCRRLGHPGVPQGGRAGTAPGGRVSGSQPHGAGGC